MPLNSGDAGKMTALTYTKVRFVDVVVFSSIFMGVYRGRVALSDQNSPAIV